MADDGYLIGYEDVNGNFVQIGQFNNVADDVTQPLVLRHTNSGETLELDGSSFRPSTQIGDTNNRPDVFANTVDLNSLVGAGLDTKADLTQSGGVLVASQLPDLAITNIDVVADQSSRLALNAEEGDVAIQTDISETFILSTNDPTVDSNWKKVQLDVLGAIDGQQITPSQTGTSTNPTTVESDTVTATNVEADDINTSKLTLGTSNEYRTAFSDSALTDALNQASSGDHIRLGSTSFTQNRTITKDFITISGTGPMFTGTDIKAEWTLDGESTIQDVSLGGTAQITVNSIRSRVSGVTMGGSTEIIINASRVLISDIIGNGASVTFANGTNNGVIDLCTDIVLTDNGSNIIGSVT